MIHIEFLFEQKAPKKPEKFQKLTKLSDRLMPCVRNILECEMHLNNLSFSMRN